MAGHTAIADANETVLTLLRREIGENDDVDIDADQIVIASPADVEPESPIRLSLFPYKVDRDPSRANESRIRTGENTFQDPPLALTTNVILSSYPPADETDHTERLQAQQTALGLAMQVLYDNSILDGDDVVGTPSAGEPLHVSIQTEANAELQTVWSRFVGTPIQPAVIYQLAPILIESAETEEVSRVSERDIDIERKPDE